MQSNNHREIGVAATKLLTFRTSNAAEARHHLDEKHLGSSRRRWRLPCSLSPSLSPNLSSVLSPSSSPSLSLFLFPFALDGLISHSSANTLLLGVLTAFLRCPPWCWMACPPSRGLVSHLVSQLVSQLVSLLVSLCGGWSHFAFSQTVCC